MSKAESTDATTTEDSIDINRDPLMDRRTMMRASGSAVGAMALGGGSMATGHSPVQRSEAGAISLTTLAAAAAIAGIGGYGGWKLKGVLSGNNNEKIEQIKADVVRNEVHGSASATAGARESLEKEVEMLLYDDKKSRNPFRETVWSEVEVEVALAAAANESIINAANKALDKAWTQSIIDMMRLWNQAWIGGEESSGLIGPVVLALSAGTGQWEPQPPGKDSNFGYPSDWSNWSDMEKLEASAVYEKVKNGEPSGEIQGYFLGKKKIPLDNFPVDPVEEGIVTEEAAKNGLYAYGCRVAHPGNVDNGGVYGPNLDGYPVELVNDGIGGFPDHSLKCKHPNRSPTNPLDFGHFAKWEDTVNDAYDDIKGEKLREYAETVDQALAEGVINPADLLSPSQAAEYFSGGDEQTEMAARLAFSGAGIPDGQFAYRAQVSHPDLESDALWGNLFISFTDGERRSLKPGSTVKKEEYRGAHFLFRRRDNGDLTKMILSDTGPLKIVDMKEVEGEKNVDQSNRDETTGENGRIDLWGPDQEVPEWVKNGLKNPDEREGETIVVETPDGKKQLDWENIKKGQDGQIYLETPYDKGTKIEGIRRVPGVDYYQPIQNPKKGQGEVNVEQIKERLETNRELINQLEELKKDGASIGIGGGGGFLGGGLPSYPGLNTAQSAAVTLVGILAGVPVITSVLNGR